MIFIADSGSTKTHWCLVNGAEESLPFYTQGFNPYVQDEEYISNAIKKELVGVLPPAVSGLQIFFYGAGCSNEENVRIIKNALSKNFPGSKIEVEHDLLAAARALCGVEKGIAAILGTGSNSCLFDGKKILENIPALGYVLGDEGSGSSLGKKLISKFLYGELPEEIIENLIGEFDLTKEDILEAVYKKPNPNRFLASFSPFLSKNIGHPFIEELVSGAFTDFFSTQISKYSGYRNYSFNSVGSIGIHFSEILKKVASSYGMKVGKIIKSPMEGLLKYHLAQ